MAGLCHEVRRTSARLILSLAVIGPMLATFSSQKKMEYLTSKAVVGPVAFIAKTQKMWRVPAPGQSSVVDLSFIIRNSGHKFDLMDTIRIRIASPNGEQFKYDGGRNGTAAGVGMTNPLRGRYVVDRKASLVWNGSALRLIGSDGLGGIWYIDGLSTGEYVVSFEYAGDGNHGSWKGHVETPPMKIRITR